VIGTVSGLIAGYTLSWAAGSYHLIPLDPQVYSVPYVPFQSSALDGMWIAGAALAISVAATLIPARAASRILPVDILRYEELGRHGAWISWPPGGSPCPYDCYAS
jgi:lipoprotein-releasing system permease protein